MTVRVAVVGSGLAGLTAAYLLSNSPNHTADLYEKHPTLGMDAVSYTLQIDPDECEDQNDTKTENDVNPKPRETNEALQHRIDVPMRSFSPGYYKALLKLYDHLKIPHEAKDHSISFSLFEDTNKIQSPNDTSARSARDAYFTYTNAIFGDFSIPFPDLIGRPELRKHAKRIIADWIRLAFVAKRMHDNQSLSELTGTLKEFLDEKGYSEVFQRLIFVPFIGSMTTCSFEAVEAYPAKIILDFLARGLFVKSPRRVTCGINEVCARLTKTVHNVRCGTTIRAIYNKIDVGEGTKEQELEGNPMVVVEMLNGKKELYHHVIIASQANQAYRLLTAHPKVSRNKPQLHALAHFEYDKTCVFTHTDASLLPADRTDWRTINVSIASSWSENALRNGIERGEDKTGRPQNSVLSKPIDGNGGFVNQPMATIWLNQMHASLAQSKDVFQTVNPLVYPDESQTLTSSWFERAVVTEHSMKGIDLLDASQGHDNVWFVGSYVYPGIPFLEGCVLSAQKVAEAIGVHAPWEMGSAPRDKYGLGQGQIRGRLCEAYFSPTTEHANDDETSKLENRFGAAFFRIVDSAVSLVERTSAVDPRISRFVDFLYLTFIGVLIWTAAIFGAIVNRTVSRKSSPAVSKTE